VSEVWVLNASPVILLDKIGRLDFLERLTEKALVPETVFREIQAGIGSSSATGSVLDWTTPRRGADVPIPLSIERWDLGPGESQVIAQCLVGAQRAVLDDAQGRECAMAHSVPVIGTLGIVLRAKQRGFIPAARPILEKLRHTGMYLSDHILNETLTLIGE
jgi:predicted nucleic acid-binding protein